MISAPDNKWEQIDHYFNNVCDDQLFVCPNCGMPYRYGYVCVACGSDNSDTETNGSLEEWCFDEEIYRE